MKNSYKNAKGIDETTNILGIRNEINSVKTLGVSAALPNLWNMKRKMFMRVPQVLAVSSGYETKNCCESIYTHYSNNLVIQMDFFI